LAAEGFDDGRRAVPAGVAEPVERVVVVGAGIAGLTVANALVHGGGPMLVTAGTGAPTSGPILPQG